MNTKIYKCMKCTSLQQEIKTNIQVSINCLNVIICLCSRFVLHLVFGIFDATVYGCSKGEIFLAAHDI